MEVRQFQVVVLQKTARNCFKTIRAAHAARLFFPRSRIKFFIYGVVVIAPVIDAKPP